MRPRCSPEESAIIESETLREEVRARLRETSDLPSIARELCMSLKVLTLMVRDFDGEEWERVLASTEEERGWHRRVLRRVVERSLTVVEKGVPMRGDDGHAVRDKNGEFVMTDAPNGASRTIIFALARLSKLGGLDAPTKNITLDIKANALTNPEAIDRILSNPRARRAMLEFELAISDLPPPPRVIEGRVLDPEGGDG